MDPCEHADAFGRRCFFVRDRDPVDVSKWAHQGGSTTVEPPVPPLIKAKSSRAGGKFQFLG